jgi:serine/threonine protein kinase
MPVNSRCPNIDVLQQFVRGRLPPREKMVVEDHTARCDDCTRRLNMLRSVTRLGASMQIAGQAGGCFDPDTLQLYARGKLERPEAKSVRQHVQQCTLCAQIVHVFETLSRPTSATPDPSQRRGAEEAAPAGTRQEVIPGHRTLPTSEGPTAAPAIDGTEFPFLAPPQQPDEIGRLGPYRILRVLGEGGMGVVFQAEDATLERLVALKVLKPEGGASKPARERFLQEAKAAASLQHDHIVTIYQVGEEWGVPFLAMQFLQGESLETRLQHEGRLPAAEVLRIGRETAEGLAAAHERGLIHRDIKPANLWLESSTDGQGTALPGRVKILDFGLARIAGAVPRHLTQAGFVVGTPGYMAPEQARAGQSLDGRCDLFSLGCVLYRMVGGQDPFQGDDPISLLMSVALEQPEPLLRLSPGAPSDLVRLINWLLQKVPQERPATARQVVELIAQLERPLSPGKRPGDTPASLKDKPRRLEAALDDVGITPWRADALDAEVASLTQPEPAAPPPSETPPAPDLSASPSWANSLGVCPRCGARRSASGLASWCLACGYYPEPEKPPEPEREMGGWIPGWVWVLMLGMVVVLGLSIAAPYLLPSGTANRAWWSLGELSVGLVLTLVGAIWAFIKSLPHRAEYSIFQLIDPTRLIEYTFRALPETRRPVWLGTWGLTAILCSAFIVGELTYFLKPHRPRQSLTVRTDEKSRVQMQQQMDEYADSAELSPEPGSSAITDPDRDTDTDLDEEPDGGKPRLFTTRCVVIGYVPDEEGNVSSLVLATDRDGKYRLAGLAGPPADASGSAERLQTLKNLVTTDPPPVPAEKLKAIWVKPDVACDVRYSQQNPDGSLQRALVKNWTK